jgi:uncharacterized protein (TIGR03066 family)
MRVRPFVGMLFLALCLASPGRAAEKEDNAKKIVGTWVGVKGEIPPGTTVEFTKDGKLKVAVKIQDKTINVEGTYKVEGDTVKITTKQQNGKEKTETIKLKTLTDTKLVTENEKGSVDEFKKK